VSRQQEQQQLRSKALTHTDPHASILEKLVWKGSPALADDACHSHTLEEQQSTHFQVVPGIHTSQIHLDSWIIQSSHPFLDMDWQDMDRFTQWEKQETLCSMTYQISFLEQQLCTLITEPIYLGRSKQIQWPGVVFTYRRFLYKQLSLLYPLQMGSTLLKFGLSANPPTWWVTWVV
jgi:hypothetical protein